MISSVLRREFITLLGGAAAAWPLAAAAQQATMPVIGWLGSGSPDVFAYLVQAFRKGLSESGFVEGRNVAIEYSWANDQLDRLPGLAANLARRRVSLVVASSTAAALAAKAASTTIPVVFQIGGDPVQADLVASLNRPGGNLTGVTSLAGELGPKRLELLHELLPAASDVAVLLNPGGWGRIESWIGWIPMQAAAKTLGIQLHPFYASNAREFDEAFAAMARLRTSALLIAPSLLFNTRGEQLAALTVRHAIPAIFQFREFAMAGGLMSYGGSITENYRILGVYTGRILKGEKPADLPVQQSTKVELIINMKTAKALGLTFPITLLGRADEVIE
jgi:putative ABC transport system substrate-binding protein